MDLRRAARRLPSAISHSHFGALKVKDAIVDRFRERTGERPNVRHRAPDVQIHAYLHRDQATLSLDLSGDSLHRRGYRRAGQSAAPLKENLAAAILLRAGWPEIAADGGALLDPMCGSGTLPIEGALIAADIAPGLLQPTTGAFPAGVDTTPTAWTRPAGRGRERRAAGLGRLGSHPRLRPGPARPSASRWPTWSGPGLAGTIHFERRELATARRGGKATRGCW